MPAAVGYTTIMPVRYVRWIAAILALTAVYACFCHAPLIWDGAFQFNITLVMQRPFCYLTRFHTFFLWWPTVWASHVTNNVTVLQAIYGLPFLMGPFASVVLSWWVVRRRAPHLVLWAVLGSCAGTLPGQIFVINDSIFTLHLFWPVFLGLFVPLSRPKRLVLAVLVVFQFVHPLGVLLLLGAALSAATVAAIDQGQRRRLLIGGAIMAALCVMALAKIEITNHSDHYRDVYAQQEATWANAWQRWRDAVVGYPLKGLTGMWLAGAMAFIRGTLRRRPQAARVIGALALLCAALGTVYWLYWSHVPLFWSTAIDYRRWVGPLTGPFFVLATLEVCRHAWVNRTARAAKPPGEFAAARPPALVAAFSAVENAAGTCTIESPPVDASSEDRADSRAPDVAETSEPDTFRGRLALFAACTFALVLGIQCTQWARLTARLMVAVKSYPSVIVPDSTPRLWWTFVTPLHHWATADYVMAVQGKAPAKVMVNSGMEENIRGNPPRLPYRECSPHPPGETLPTPGSGGWFDFRPLLKELAKEPLPPPRPTTDRSNLKTVQN
ncbi:MAG: hypothetical protein JWO87_1228 [Phycisphaerales bacterium]|nr:hypothetical protein [Phycisphaerales bacterium]